MRPWLRAFIKSALVAQGVVVIRKNVIEPFCLTGLNLKLF